MAQLTCSLVVFGFVFFDQIRSFDSCKGKKSCTEEWLLYFHSSRKQQDWSYLGEGGHFLVSMTQQALSGAPATWLVQLIGGFAQCIIDQGSFIGLGPKESNFL